MPPPSDFSPSLLVQPRPSTESSTSMSLPLAAPAPRRKSSIPSFFGHFKKPIKGSTLNNRTPSSRGSHDLHDSSPYEISTTRISTPPQLPPILHSPLSSPLSKYAYNSFFDFGTPAASPAGSVSASPVESSSLPSRSELTLPYISHSPWSTPRPSHHIPNIAASGFPSSILEPLENTFSLPSSSETIPSLLPDVSSRGHGTSSPDSFHLSTVHPYSISTTQGTSPESFTTSIDDIMMETGNAKRYSFLPSFDDLDDEDGSIESDASPRASDETSPPITPSDTHFFTEPPASGSISNLKLPVPEDGKHMTAPSHDVVDHDDDFGSGCHENTLHLEANYSFHTADNKEKDTLNGGLSPTPWLPNEECTPSDDDISDILEGMRSFVVPTVPRIDTDDDASSETNSIEFLHFPLPPGLSSSRVSAAAAEEELVESPIDPQLVEPGSARRSFVPRYYARLRPSTVVWTTPGPSVQPDFHIPSSTPGPRSTILLPSDKNPQWFQLFEESSRRHRRTRTLSDPTIGLKTRHWSPESSIDRRTIQLTLPFSEVSRQDDKTAPTSETYDDSSKSTVFAHELQEDISFHEQDKPSHITVSLGQSSLDYTSSSSLDSFYSFPRDGSSSANLSTSHAPSQKHRTLIQSKAIRNSILKPYHVSPSGSITPLSSDSASQASIVSTDGTHHLQSKLSRHSRSSLRVAFVQPTPTYSPPAPIRRAGRTVNVKDPGDSFLDIDEQRRMRRISVISVLSSATSKAGHGFRKILEEPALRL